MREKKIVLGITIIGLFALVLMFLFNSATENGSTDNSGGNHFGYGKPEVAELKTQVEKRVKILIGCSIDELKLISNKENININDVVSFNIRFIGKDILLGTPIDFEGVVKGTGHFEDGQFKINEATFERVNDSGPEAIKSGCIDAANNSDLEKI